MRLLRPSTPGSAVVTGPLFESLSPYNAGTTYAAGDRVFGTNVYTNDQIYESLAAGNLGNPLTDTTKWVFVSASNPYRMFDNVSNSQTTAADSIVAEFAPDQVANMVALFNISAATAEVEVTVSGVTVYDEVQSLTFAGDGVTDWYSYFFGDLNRRTDALFLDLPSYAGQVVTVTVTDIGNTVAIGTLAVGAGLYLGDTQYGARVGITDYSRKVADDFGQYQIVERPFSKRGSFTVRTPNSQVDAIANLLPQYRATPVLFIGADDFTATYIYGFMKDWGIEITYVSHSTLSFEIEGLT